MTFTSPYARMVRIVIIEKRLDGIEIVAAQTRKPDSPYYTINPSGRVPYLIRNDGVGMEDSRLICAYLDQLDGSPLFDLPANHERWEAQRLEASARSLLDGLTVWQREIARPENERSPTIIEHERQRSRRLINFWESAIDHPLMNGKLNMAEITLISALDIERRNPGFAWRAGHPRLSAWTDGISERPSIAETVPNVQA